MVNGDELTGRELRDRLGADADVILRVSYLSAADQRDLVAAPPPAAPPSGTPILEPPPPPDIPVPPAPAPPSRRVRRGGDVVRVFGNVTVPRDERVDGDVVVVFGNATIDGEVDGELTIVMGNANLGPDSVVRRDVNVVGGTLNRATGARIDGSIDNVAVGDGPWTWRPWPAWGVPGFMIGTFLGRLGNLGATLLRVALIALLALAAVAFGRGAIERIADHTAADPVRAGLVGFLAQLLFFPLLIITVIVLAISIIGIPLLVLVPFGIVLVLLVLLVGFTGVAYQVGRWLNARFGWTGRGEYATVFLGVVAIGLVTVLARSSAVVGGGFLSFPFSAVGYVIEYVAWTSGFGAAILVWLQRRRTPPPLPPPAS
ncbi:MAG: hypothetical protein HY657_14695 [Acidobacteria bacterium]|nr:hypothetical protein [Acidobacteriota bacterium]